MRSSSSIRRGNTETDGDGNVGNPGRDGHCAAGGLKKKSAIAAGVGPSPTCSIGAASVATSRQSISDGAITIKVAPDDLRRASHAEQLDEKGHLVEQLAVSTVLTGFA